MVDQAKIVFLGTPDFAVPVLEALVAAGYEVPLVVTQPDKPVGRKQILTAPPVKQAAERLGLQVSQPVKVRTAIDEIAALEPAILLTAAYGQLLPQRLLDLPAVGSLNVHASLLPRWRGAAPIHRAIMAGDEETGVTIMEMVKELDAGPMVSQVRVQIGPDDTVGTMHNHLADAGARLLIETLPGYLSGQRKAVPQPEQGITYAERILPKDERIDWAQPVDQVHNHVRGLSPWPVARTDWQGKPMKIWSTRPTVYHGPETGSVGDVLCCPDGTVVVRCADGWIALQTVQPAGKRPMAAEEWVRGVQSGRTKFEMGDPA